MMSNLKLVRGKLQTNGELLVDIRSGDYKLNINKKPAFFINQTTRYIGIGTESPEALLDILGNIGEIRLKVVVPPETKNGNYQLIIRVSSINALIESGQDIYDNINLTVIVLESDKPVKPDDSDGSEDDSLLVIILVSIIMIIIAMELAHKFSKSRKEDEEVKPKELKKKIPKGNPKEKN